MDQERDLILQPLTVEEIQALARQAGTVDRLLSTKSPKYKSLATSGTLARDWAQLMAEEPRLIKRPLLVVDDQVVVGFDEALWRRALNLPVNEGQSR
ncbi:MAG: arsenate reductase [Firmicutes bacterium]|nr:arsenate reductase [Bacillota bacterium]